MSRIKIIAMINRVSKIVHCTLTSDSISIESSITSTGERTWGVTTGGIAIARIVGTLINI
jgi:hypothetical protein